MPVSIVARLGEQDATLANESGKRVPDFASASRFGVLATGSPVQPRCMPRSSAMSTTTFFFSAAPSGARNDTETSRANGRSIARLLLSLKSATDRHRSETVTFYLLDSA